jgi:hypothetical protein
MPYDASTYDDDREITDYIWHNFRNLLTSLESLTDRALVAEAKALSSNSDAMARRLREKWGAEGNPEVVPELSDGPGVFRDRVRDRILRESADKVFINRCALCSRIVATPHAQQHLTHSNAFGAATIGTRLENLRLFAVVGASEATILPIESPSGRGVLRVFLV